MPTKPPNLKIIKDESKKEAHKAVQPKSELKKEKLKTEKK